MCVTCVCHVCVCVLCRGGEGSEEFGHVEQQRRPLFRVAAHHCAGACQHAVQKNTVVASAGGAGGGLMRGGGGGGGIGSLSASEWFLPLCELMESGSQCLASGHGGQREGRRGGEESGARTQWQRTRVVRRNGQMTQQLEELLEGQGS